MYYLVSALLIMGLVLLVSTAVQAENEKNQTYYIKQGMKLWKEGNLSELRRLLDEGLERFPESANLWDIEGFYYFEKGDKPKSLAALQRAIIIKPTELRYENLGWYYFKLAKDYKSALIYLKKAEKRTGKKPLFDYTMAKCYENTGDLDSAKKYYVTFLEKDTNSEEAKDARKSLNRIKALTVVVPSPPPDNVNLSGPQDPPQPDCCFHIWATGCNLGWACSLLKYTKERERWEEPDEPTARFLTTAGRHVRAAHFTCSKMNPAWPDWQDKKRFLDRQVDRFRSKPNHTTRLQLWNTVKGLTHWGDALKRQVVYYKQPQTFANKPTCGEKYYLLGFYLAYAQQSLKIAAEARDEGRNDWQQAMSDGFFHLQKAQDILEQYYLVQTGHCVEIKDLKLKERIQTIRQPQNSHKELDDRIARLDEVISEAQLRILSECVECRPENKPTPGGRLTFEINNVHMKPWVTGGEVYFDLKITLGEGEPVTLNFFEYNLGSFPIYDDELEVDWNGKKHIFKGKGDPGKNWIIQRGHRSIQTQVQMRPGETITLSKTWMSIYNPGDWGHARIFDIEYTDKGETVNELSPVLAPSDYWATFVDMARRVPARRQKPQDQ